MQFIEALKFRSRLFFLFMLITLGLITVGILGAMHIQAMKKNMDALYFGSLVPVTELNEIIQNYNIGLAGTIHSAVRSEISPDETLLKIKNSLTTINTKWSSYASHFKRNEELEYVEYVASEIQSTNSYFSKVHSLVNEGGELHKLNLTLLEKKVSFISAIVQKLIAYEVSIAAYERKMFLQNYDDTLKQLGFFLLFIVLGVLLISYYVFRSIQKDHTELQSKTKKLKTVNKKLENVSYTDALTGLHNRRYFNHVYDKELRRAKRNKTYITFMMLDIDFFKQYNDTYGHLEGDIALKNVAIVLRERLKRPSDYVFRLGGEEFGILLSEIDETNSAKLAREICDALRAKEMKHESSKVSDWVSISIGVVCCVADEALDDEVLLSRADEMLYKAKESGRDRYIITTDVSSATVKKLQEEQIA